MELINEKHPRPLTEDGSKHDPRMLDICDFNSKAPKTLRGLVAHCLYAEPEKRPTASEVNRELRDILQSLQEERGEEVQSPSKP